MKVNVVYWADEKFTRYAYLSIFSILKSMSKSSELFCYFITTMPNKYISNIKNLESIFSNFKLCVISINEKIFSKLPVNWEIGYLNASTYYRLGVSLIEWVEKIIYFDSDTIINDDIEILFQESLDWKIVGVCSDMPKDYIATYINTLNLKQNKYFNSWMLLINLDKWKKKHISEKCISLIKKQAYKFGDQDPLNIILQDDCKWLRWNYNVQTEYFFRNDEEFKNIWFNEKYYSEAVIHPVVIHYTWPDKPRKVLCCNPHEIVYRKVWLVSLKIWESRVNVGECLAYIAYKIRKLLIPNYEKRRKLRMKLHNVQFSILRFYARIRKI